MCGLAGSFRTPFDVDGALDKIAHRGPDGRGVKEHGEAVHGHVRLALLDPNGSQQPYGDCLTFNGEIWNFRDLEPDAAGDTGVLYRILDECGRAGLRLLDGMFALAWRDEFLARDRLGKVPLYYARQGDGFVWASERRALPSRAVALPPGSLLDLQTGKVIRWYEPHGEPRGELLPLLRAAVRKRLVADAPLCVLCSGGLDSSLVLALAKELKPDVVAFTAVLEEGSEDHLAARMVCETLEVKLVEVPVPAPDADALTRAALAIELPTKAQVEIAALCLPLAEAIRNAGFKACLSGEAADEIFGGYGNMAIKAASVGDQGWREIRLAQVEKMGRGNFVRCNKAFMAKSVECRLPFADYRLVEHVLAMSKSECPPGKGALKAVAREVLPQPIIARRKDTFQGGSGMSAAAARAVANPTRFYNAEIRRVYGSVVRE